MKPVAGRRGNVLPSELMTITSGFGWFAVNSVSASFAMSSLTGASPVLWLVVVVVVQVVVAFFGHNLVHAFERFAFPVLAVVMKPSTAIEKISSPSAQSGRDRYRPERICSTVCACNETPGTFSPSAVVRISCNPTADVPTKTMLPSIAAVTSGATPPEARTFLTDT